MREAIPKFIGKHDFSSFRARGCQAKTPIRSINMTEIDQEDKKISSICKFDFVDQVKSKNIEQNFSTCSLENILNS